jgi:hypothetical protein
MPFNANQNFQRSNQNQSMKSAQKAFNQMQAGQQKQFADTARGWHASAATLAQQQQQRMRRVTLARRHRDVDSSVELPEARSNATRSGGGGYRCRACQRPAGPGAGYCTNCGSPLDIQPLQVAFPRKSAPIRQWPVVVPLGVLALIVLVVWVIASTTAGSTVPSSPPSAVTVSTGGTILHSAKVRTGPGIQHRIVGVARIDTKIVIACRTGTAADPWDRLQSPHPGRYVSATRVRSPRPPRC